MGKYPRTWFGDLMASCHWPRAACFFALCIIGAMLAPVVDWLRLGLALLAAHFYLQWVAYSVDILKGNHVGVTNFGPWHHKVRIGVGTVAALAIGFYLSWTISLLLLPLAIVGLVLVVGYNFESLSLHNRIVFAGAWGLYPLVSHYVLMTLAIPPVHVWVFGIAAAVFAWLHITAYANFRCALPVQFCCVSENKKDCHGQDPRVRRECIPSEVHRAAKRQAYLQVYFLLLLTVSLMLLKLGW